MNFAALFKDCLPQDRVISDQLQALYGHTTTGFQRMIFGALKPITTQEIQDIVKIAITNNLSLYPIATGKNWGYSDSLPVADNNIIIDLSMMNKIIAYNKDFSYVTIEPGVTQKQLADYLKSNGDHHIISATGSSPHASIIGNYLERGFGLAPIIDHASAVTSLKAILADGSLYEPVLAAKGCDLIDKLCKNGLGPAINGLFFQSGLGIVTEITIKLAKKPETSSLIVAYTDKTNLSAVTDALRRLRQKWDLPSLSIKFFNSPYALAGSNIPYPQDYLNKNEALPPALLQKMQAKEDLPPYSVFVTFSGPASLTKALAEDIRKTIKPLSQKYIAVDQKKYELAKKLQNCTPKSIQKKISVLTKIWSYLEGQPSEGNMNFTYWRTGRKPNTTQSINPAHDHCGAIWYAPYLPFDGESILRFENMMHDICPQFSITPMINITNYADNYVVALAPILFDQKTQTQQAQDCYLKLLEEGLKWGIAPYRLPSFAMQYVFKKEDYASVIKNALDPKHIISPKRYSA